MYVNIYLFISSSNKSVFYVVFNTFTRTSASTFTNTFPATFTNIFTMAAHCLGGASGASGAPSYCGRGALRRKVFVLTGIRKGVREGGRAKAIEISIYIYKYI